MRYANDQTMHVKYRPAWAPQTRVSQPFWYRGPYLKFSGGADSLSTFLVPWTLSQTLWCPGPPLRYCGPLPKISSNILIKYHAD